MSTPERSPSGVKYIEEGETAWGRLTTAEAVTECPCGRTERLRLYGHALRVGGRPKTRDHQLE